ncbi:MAG: LysR family transcriptional regulator [Burkholderiaceae bacterium]
MELYQLRTFAAVAEERHLTRAAEHLHLSQPAVSGHLKSLETELGLRLFERTPSGMELTDAGRQLLERARQVLSAVDDVKRVAQQMHGDEAACCAWAQWLTRHRIDSGICWRMHAVRNHH